ncbi:MAG: hypothetical protein WC805_01425 [Patescibacteria group bacterium]|jgi:archaellum component FlaC
MPELSQAIINQYIDILEKTNHQLSLSWNPYNTILTIMLFIIAFLTVIFAVVVYFQGTEYKKKLNEDKINFDIKIKDLFSKHDKQVSRFINERKSKLKEIDKNYVALIDQYEQKLKVLESKPTGEKRRIEEIEKSIERIKTERDILKTSGEPVIVTPDYFSPLASSFGGDTMHKCSVCHYGFKVKGPSDYNTIYSPLISGGKGMVACPKCGNVDTL